MYECYVVDMRTTSLSVHTVPHPDHGNGEGPRAPLDGDATATTTTSVGSYTGQMVNGQPHGVGTLKYTNGGTYTGDWRAGKRDGRGVQRSSDGTVYDGEWRDDAPDGTGCESQPPPSGASYEGAWLRGGFHGAGTRRFRDGSTYTGEWKYGQMHGRGRHTAPDGAVYDGEWEEDRRHGSGVLTLSDGGVYDGEWKWGHRSGRGTYKSASDGSVYDGRWDADKKHGPGSLRWLDGVVCSGEWNKGALEGCVTFEYPASDDCGAYSTTGTFRNGWRQGEMTYSWVDGSRTLKCHWVEDKPDAANPVAVVTQYYVSPHPSEPTHVPTESSAAAVESVTVCTWICRKTKTTSFFPVLHGEGVMSEPRTGMKFQVRYEDGILTSKTVTVPTAFLTSEGAEPKPTAPHRPLSTPIVEPAIVPATIEAPVNPIASTQAASACQNPSSLCRSVMLNEPSTVQSSTPSIETGTGTRFQLQTASVDEVCEWLAGVGVEQPCIDIIRANKLRGRTLTNYTVAQLCALGIVVGDAEFIIEEIRALSNNSISPASPLPSERLPSTLNNLNFKCFAFVVGNGAYCQSPLQNTLHDAAELSQFLEGVCKFEVTHLKNIPSLQEFVCHLEKFKETLKAAKKAKNKIASMFFFAGHGRQMKGHNFLMMTEDETAFTSTNFDVLKFRAPMLGDILDGLKKHSDMVICILDACRQSDDTDEERMRGFGAKRKLDLAKEEFPHGCFVLYPTSPGKLTRDECKLPNRRNHGFFTGCLMEVLEQTKPGTSFNDLVDSVIVMVQGLSKYQQTPWVSKSVGQPFALF
ncbi:Morn repeat protein [Pelomyxa schiedti]|nr:Morn repeat protein [Pelomyxa schiedti]